MVVGVAVVAVAAILAIGGVWALRRDTSPGPQPTGLDVVVTDPPATDPPATDPPPTDPPLTDPPATGAGAIGLGTAELATILLTAEDLPGDASPPDTIRAEGTEDADHPLLDLAYCDIQPPMEGVGGAAADVYNLASGPVDVALSSAVVTDSEERARQVLDRVIANAGTCDSYATGNGTIEPGDVSEVGGGAVRLEITIVVLGQRFPSAVYLATAGPLLLVVELPASVDRPTGEGLIATLVDRAHRLVDEQ